MTLDEYLAASGVARPRPHELVAFGHQTRTCDHQRVAAAALAAADSRSAGTQGSATALADSGRRLGGSDPRLPPPGAVAGAAADGADPVVPRVAELPYKSSDRRREHLRRIMLNTD